jgi:hypothetical protein
MRQTPKPARLIPHERAIIGRDAINPDTSHQAESARKMHFAVHTAASG